VPIYISNNYNRPTMNSLPEAVSDAWDDREPLVVLTTVNKDGEPNSIYVGVVGRYDETTFFIANNYFSKTRQNILDDGKASLLFLTKERKSFQLKGTLELHDSGPVHEAMKKINPTQYPGNSVAVLHVTQVFSGSVQLA